MIRESYCVRWLEDSQRRPLINVMAVSESGTMFLKAIYCEGDYKDKYFISNLIKKLLWTLVLKMRFKLERTML